VCAYVGHRVTADGLSVSLSLIQVPTVIVTEVGKRKNSVWYPCDVLYTDIIKSNLLMCARLLLEAVSTLVQATLDYPLESSVILQL